MATSRVKGIIVEIGGDTSALEKALSKVNSSTASLSKELRGVNSLLKLDPKNTEMLSQKQKILKENIKETSKKLEQLKETQKIADEQIANGTKISDENYRALQREIANTENKLKSLKTEASNWTKAGKSIEEFGTKVTNISNKIDKLGTTITTRLTLPIVGIATASVTAGNSFEAQMSRVKAIAGATNEELEKLTNQAVELGAKTSFSASEVAQGMENLASAGFTSNEIMEAMPGLLDLAASSGAELATSAEITASALRGFGLEASNSAHVADVFAEAAARTNAQTEDMGEAMKYVAPVAKTVGLSIEETAAAIGIMSDAGIKGSQAGTTLRGGLTRIIKPTKQVKEAMETLGVEFYDNEGKMKSLTEIVKTLQDKTKNLTDETKNQALAQIFGTEALSGMLALVNRGSDELADMTKSFKKCDGAAANMAETMLDNTSGALESLSGSFESAGIAIQKALAPQIKDLAKKVQSLVDNFTELSEEEQQNIIKIAAFVAAIGPAIKILGTLGKGIGTVTTGIGTFSQAIAVAKNNSTSTSESVNKLASVIGNLTSPAGLATVAIVTVAGWLAYLAVKQQEATKKTKELSEEVTKQKQEYEDYNKSIDETTRNNLAQIDSTSRLKEELKTLVDENGKVKKGYETRVSFILNELSNTLGIECKLNGNVIDSYKDLQKEIDETIEKKRAEIIINAKQEKYAKAKETETEATKKQKEALDQLGMSIGDARNKYQELKEKKEEFERSGNIYGSKYLDTSAQMTNLKNLIDAYNNAGDTIKQCIDNEKDWENDYALWVEGKYNEIGQTVINTTKNWTNTSIKEIQNAILQEQSDLEKYQQMYKDTGSEISQEQIKQSQKNLQNLANELAERTNTIGALGVDEIAAWKTLANSSYEEYKRGLSKVGPTTQEEIQKATGIIVEDENIVKASADKAYEMTTNFDNKLELGDKTKIEINNTAATINNDTSVGKASADKAYEMTTNFDNKLKLGDTTKNEIDDTALTINKDTSVGDASADLGDDVNTGFNSEVDGWTWGWDLVKNIYDGLTNKKSKNWISKGASSIASIIKSILGFSLPEKGPLSDFDTSMPDMIDLMSKGINDNKGKIINSAERLANDLYKTLNNDIKFPQIHDFGKLQGKLSNKIIDSTKTVYTTPQIVFNVQELDEAKLQQCFDYINRKFGSKY